MKPNKLILFSLILFILVFGCNAPASLATTSTVPASTAGLPKYNAALNTTLSPTAVPPTPVPPTPTATVRGPLSPNGPYLAYQDQVGDQTYIKLLDADGTGQSIFSYPTNAAPFNLNLPYSNTISPDGKWMAYYSGSAGTCFGEVGPDTSDLSLNLMSLSDGKTRVVTRLLSKDYPANFVKAAQQLGRADVTADMLQNTFVCTINQALDWSPDGRYLAFAGQMDGLSSDIYLYDSVSGAIKRYSSGPEEIVWICWSPDGKWILDGSTYWVGEGMQNNIYATSANGVTINQLSKGTPQVVTSSDWLDDHSYFDSNGANGPGDYDLKLVDVNTGTTSIIWRGSYSPFAFIPSGNWVTLQANTLTWPENGSDFQTGIFLVDTTSLKQTRVNSSGPWGSGYPPEFTALGYNQDKLFLVRNISSGEIQFLSSDGNLTSSGVQAERISVSPDRLDWIAIAGNLQVFSDDGSLIRIVDLPANLDPKNIGTIIWRPDSSGLFFTYKNSQDQSSRLGLYALDLAKGNPTQVDTLSPTSPSNFLWVSGLR